MPDLWKQCAALLKTENILNRRFCLATIDLMPLPSTSNVEAWKVRHELMRILQAAGSQARARGDAIKVNVESSPSRKPCLQFRGKVFGVIRKLGVSQDLIGKECGCQRSA